jgi:hypothetical protein
MSRFPKPAIVTPAPGAAAPAYGVSSPPGFSYQV